MSQQGKPLTDAELQAIDEVRSSFEQMAKDAARYRKIRDDLSIETLYYIDKCASTPQEFDDMVDDLLDVSKE